MREWVTDFLDRPIKREWPYLWIDATDVKVREAGRIVSVAVIVAVGVNGDGRWEVLGMDVDPSKAETFWTTLPHASWRAAHRIELHSTNSLDRLNREIKRRTEVIGIFSTKATIVRLVGAILLEQNDGWAVQRARYMILESITPIGDGPPRRPANSGSLTDPALAGNRGGLQ